MGVNIGRIRMKNPVLVASGTYGYGEEYQEFVDINKLGTIEYKRDFVILEHIK